MSAHLVVVCDVTDADSTCTSWFRDDEASCVDAARAAAAAEGWTRLPDGGDRCPSCGRTRPRLILDFPDRGSQ